MYSLGMILRLGLFILSWGALNALLCWRFLAGWQVARSVKIAFCVLVVSSFVITPLAFWLGGEGGSWLKNTAFLLMGLLSLTYTLIIARDAVLLVGWVFQRFDILPDVVSPERRALIKDAANWSILAGASTVGLEAAVNAREMPNEREVKVPI